MDAPALRDWLLARARRRGRPSVAATAPGASPAGAQGSFPPVDSPLGWATGARAGSACVPAGRSGRPLLARVVAVRLAAQSRLG
jgi:hypothetical protein